MQVLPFTLCLLFPGIDSDVQVSPVMLCLLLLGIDPEVQVPETGAVLCTVLEEQKSRKQNQQPPLSGPELAAMMKIGTVVMRGVDWKWGDQVCPLSVCLPVCLFIYMADCQSGYPSIHLFTWLTPCLIILTLEAGWSLTVPQRSQLINRFM